MKSCKSLLKGEFKDDFSRALDGESAVKLSEVLRTNDRSVKSKASKFSTAEVRRAANTSMYMSAGIR